MKVPAPVRLLALPCLAAVFINCGDTPTPPVVGDGDTIEAAIEAAIADGSNLVTLAEGTYTIGSPLDFRDRRLNITIRSAGNPGSAVIKAEDCGGCPTMFHVGSGTITMENLTFDGSGLERLALAVWVGNRMEPSWGYHIRNNEFRNFNTAAIASNMGNSEESSPLNVESNTFASVNQAISIASTYNATIKNNIADSGIREDAFLLSYSKNNVISGNQFSSILITDSEDNRFSDNTGRCRTSGDISKNNDFGNLACTPL